MENPNIREFNRRAWDAQVKRGNQWTVPVTAEQVASARRGDWRVVLTPAKVVPQTWFGGGDISDVAILGLASGGGQQGPIFAAAGARVTIYDNSPAQLAQDREVAEREGLEIATVEGDMRDLAAFDDGAFDLVFHPVANCFIPDVAPVWREAFRVLRPGGRLLAGFCNPVMFMVDFRELEKGQLVIRHKIPYSDAEDLTPEEWQEFEAEDSPLTFGHTLADQIGGQLEAGLVLRGFYEDAWPDFLISEYIPCFGATLAVKPNEEVGR